MYKLSLFSQILKSIFKLDVFFKDILTVLVTLQGSSFGAGSKLDFHMVACKCARFMFNSTSVSVGDSDFNSIDEVSFPFPVLVFHMTYLERIFVRPLYKNINEI